MKPIYLRLSKPFGELAVEASRFWGSPALPKGMDYPQYIDDAGDEYPYVFVCQINLAELKAFCGDGADPLPPTGLLLFFAKIDHYLGQFADTDCIGGAISAPDAVKVIYVKDCSGLREVVLVDDEDQPMSPDALEISFTREHDPLADYDQALFARPDHREWESWAPLRGLADTPANRFILRDGFQPQLHGFRGARLPDFTRSVAPRRFLRRPRHSSLHLT